MVDLGDSQEVGALGGSTVVAPLQGDFPIKKRTRPGPLDDQAHSMNFCNEVWACWVFRDSLPRSAPVTDVTPFTGPSAMRVGGYAAVA